MVAFGKLSVGALKKITCFRSGDPKCDNQNTFSKLYLTTKIFQNLSIS